MLQKAQGQAHYKIRAKVISGCTSDGFLPSTNTPQCLTGPLIRDKSDHLLCLCYRYVISAPKILRVASSEKVVIQAFGYEQEFPVTISVKSFPDKQTTYALGHAQLTPANQFQGSVTVTIQPKDLSSRDPKKPVEYVYLEATSPHFTKEKKMPITYENGFLFIQTDKPIYTPDQSVKVRVYSLNEELRPARRSVTLTIDPEGVEVDIINEDDVAGIVSFPDFKIPPHPKYGVWKIKAKYQTIFATSAVAPFQVKKYAMPRFSVTIEPESNFISSQKFERFKITIKARNGVKLGPVCYGVAELYFNSKSAVSEIGYHDLQELDDARLYIAVSVVEIRGGHSEDSELSTIVYTLSPYKQNLVATPLFVKPGLPYVIKVQVKDTMDAPVRNLPVVLTVAAFDVDLTRQPLPESGTTQTTQTDGMALFVVNIPANTKILEFRVTTADPRLPEENQASKSYEAKSYVSLSGSYLYIDWASNHKKLLVGETVHVNIYPSSHYIDKIHHYSYLILSKGKIIRYGTQGRIQGTNYQGLQFQLTKEMVPSARILVYYIVTGEGAAELVADSVWLNIEEKCKNSLEVSNASYRPKDVISLSMTTQFDSLVALSSMDKAIYGVTGEKKRPMEKALLKLESSDLGCGAGGGQNNIDVFRMAGLTFMTNANADDSKEAGKVLQHSSPESKNECLKKVALSVQKCCKDGAETYPFIQTCAERLKRLTGGRRCRIAFANCCNRVNNLRSTETHRVLLLARHRKWTRGTGWDSLLLWMGHHNSLPVTLPDSITTWEIQGVSISDEGICVADALQVEVQKEVFISVHVPYSVVRGEQIELRGTVYNYRSSMIRFCATISVGQGICLFGAASTNPRGLQSTHCSRPKELQGFSTSLVKFKILPLELGLHTINFTLGGTSFPEILVKTLRVVPEGIQKEIHEGHTLDPQGIYGVVKRQQEFHRKIPPNMVPKTKLHRTVSVKGLLLGEVIDAAVSPEGLKFLAYLPRGSAETELMNIVPVFYVFDFLERTDSWDILGAGSITPRLDLRRKMKEGTLAFLELIPDSADMQTSSGRGVKLTAFVLRIFGQVHQYVTIDRDSVCLTLEWMIDICQMGDGSFREISTYEPVKLQGTLPNEKKEKTLYLTAFSLIGFEKVINLCPLQKIEDAKNKAANYLLQHFKSAQSTFSLAIVTYALTLTNFNQAGARTAYMGPPMYRFWKESSSKLDQATPSKETARMVETTAYASLTTLLQGDKAYANPIIRWLSEQQRYGGGFYSTQDTLNALEALTEYSVLTKRLDLDMSIKTAYSYHGDFHHYRLTRGNYIGKPVEVSGTVYYKSSTSEDDCSFELKIDIKQPFYRTGSFPLLFFFTLCRYRPHRLEPRSSSSHAVMDISLVTGLEANLEDLSMLANNVDHLISDYEVKDGHVVVQLDSVPGSTFLCIGFRVTELFRVGMPSPGTFTVYEYHTPDKRCTIFYNAYGEDSLVRLCEGSECKCMEAECGRMQTRLDRLISSDSRKEAACQNDIAYVYKVNILALREEGSFIKYTAILLDLYKRGETFAEKNAEIIFIKKTSCMSVQLKPREDYLIMGKEALKIGEGINAKFQYPLDAMTWIEWWPSESSPCNSCQDFIETMEEFAEDLFINGC
uniref:Complement C5 n=1 Tax=Varanus komodoensis TaxID=61221 RepID=A0A8D2JHJ7_VARKO